MIRKLNESKASEVYDDLYNYADNYRFTTRWTKNNVEKKVNGLKKMFNLTDIELSKIIDKVNKDFKHKNKVKSEPYSDSSYKTESNNIRKSSKLNEAESYGWVVEDWQASEAYELVCDYFGEDYINKQIVDCMSNEELAECLAYIFRMNDFREWDEYLEKEDNKYVDESCKKKSKKKSMKEYIDEAHGVIKCVETGEEYGYSSLVDREWIIADLVDKGYTYKDRPVRIETGYREYDNYLD